MSKKAKYEELASKVLELVGGKDNITFLTHCITRLRFNVKDKSIIKIKEIESTSGIIGCQWAGEQLQIIIGATVNEVYDAICAQAGLEKPNAIDENLDGNRNSGKRKFSINGILETLSACIVPVIPAMAGAGIIRGVLILLTTHDLISTDTGVFVILNAISEAAFYFLPFLVAVGAAKKFNTSLILSLVLAGLYLHPSITELAGETLNVAGFDINIVRYSSTVFPIIISIWVMSYLYRFIDSWMPKSLRIVFSPAITVLVMAFICLGIIGPLGFNIGYYVGNGIAYIFGLFPALGGLLLGVIRPIVILTGMQAVFTTIIANNVATLGYDFISPVHTVASMAAAGMCLGAFLRAKKLENKENFISSFVSGFIGITEPALFGIAFRFRRQLIALMIGGGVSGAIVAAFEGKRYAAGMPSWIMLPAFGDTIPVMLIGLAVALILTAILSYIFGFDEKNQ
ncbi:PTS transporter subunit EIIC [Bacillus haynesii]|uniref:PTS transporter subunit EIIC n=1 Tax=Bacillus haynesii TaxID=1925021 RepID=UPI001F61BCF2|nr:PTS transporter subunit EIIC [Bacillus haynesii]